MRVQIVDAYTAIISPITDDSKVVEVTHEVLEKLGVTYKLDISTRQVIAMEYAEIAQREENFQKQQRIPKLKETLSSYSEDLLQAMAGVHIPDLEERKKRFVEAHSELRRLEGKPPRRV